MWQVVRELRLRNAKSQPGTLEIHPSNGLSDTILVLYF